MNQVNYFQVSIDILQAVISGVFVGLVIYWLDERRAKRERRLSDYRIASNWYTTEPQVSLRNFDLTKANLSRCEFTGANLEGAIFREGRMYKTNFNGANLREADFRKSVVVGASFKDITAYSANFSRATIWRDPDHEYASGFTNAILKDAKFVGAKLTLISMVAANLHNADFTKATLENCDFSNSDLTGSKWLNVRKVKNCAWKNVKVGDAKSLPNWLVEEIQTQNVKRTRKKHNAK